MTLRASSYESDESEDESDSLSESGEGVLSRFIRRSMLLFTKEALSLFLKRLHYFLLEFSAASMRGAEILKQSLSSRGGLLSIGIFREGIHRMTGGGRSTGSSAEGGILSFCFISIAEMRTTSFCSSSLGFFIHDGISLTTSDFCRADFVEEGRA